MIKKTIIGISILLISLVGVYQFMTASRPFDLGIEIKQKMNEIAKNNNLNVSSDQIDVTEINRPTIKRIRTETHKVFNKLNLMTYGREMSEKYTFTNIKGDTLIVCKTLMLGDHLRILEIQLKSTNEKYKNDFEDKFTKDHIIWLDKNKTNIVYSK